MKYVTYDLYLDNGEGKQPYVDVASYGASFQGGIFKADKYFGYILGDAETAFTELADKYNFTELTQEEAIALYGAEFSGAHQDDNGGYTYSEPIINPDGTLTSTIVWT